MAGEKKIEKPEPMSAGLKSDPITKLAEQGVASGKDRMPSDSTSSSSSGDTTSGMKGESDQDSVGEHGVYYPPTSCYNYHYPGYNGSFTQSDRNEYHHADGSYPGMQSDNGSFVYYMPGYNPYAVGALVGVDGQCANQQQYFASYGSEAMPCYAWDSTYVGDAFSGTATGYGIAKSGTGSKSNGFSSTKTNGNVASKFPKSIPHTNSIKSPNKVPHLGSGFSAGLLKGFYPVGKFSSFTNQKPGPFPRNGPMNYRPNGRTWNGTDKINLREKPTRNVNFESSPELTRGPRACNKSAPLDSEEVKKEELGPTVHRDHYNLPDFQTEYENAKFYVIKSYNEDDIHKCIKYDVWASTPNGNRKLDAAFRDTKEKESLTGTKCPIFLFFSVNGSGQFVGVAEMIGMVDFKKDMNFWQLDKWNGFFPIKWHIVKDIPNTQLRHIILENNDNRPVTFSRDTQEIGLKQGLEMLNIFKNFTAKTSLLDDLKFYENREKFLHVKRGTKSATPQREIHMNGDYPRKNINFGEKKSEEESIGTKQISDPTSLISLTKNLSLNGSPLKSNP